MYATCLQKVIKKIFFIVLTLLIYTSSFSQNIKTVTGYVSNNQNDPLAGVTITVVGDSRGVLTDEKGGYSIDVRASDRLQFSYLGMNNQIIPVEDKSIINVVMIPKIDALEDVVVVALGEQKKSDMVGSVVSVNPAELQTSSSNLTTALAGRVPGMIAFQRSGEPGADNADFFVRGVSSFGVGKVNPLILVDGVETSTTDFAQLRPDDIEQFSVLKDATATAVYGSKAANGIIVVKTKSGQEGKAKVSLRAEGAVSTPTENVEFADPVTYMKMYNDAQIARNPFNNPRYSQTKIIGTGLGDNPYIFPATDWKNELFKKSTFNQRYSLNVKGGGKVARYFISGSLYQDNGLLKVDQRNNFNNNINLKQYSLRSNINVDITKTTEVVVRLNGNFDDYVGPIESATALYNKVVHTSQVDFPAYYPIDAAHSEIEHIMFGGLEQESFDNPYADLVRGYKSYNRSLMSAQLELNQKLSFIAKGLSFRALMNTNRLSRFALVRSYSPFYYALNNFDVSTGQYGIINFNPTTGTDYLDYSLPSGERQQESNFHLESGFTYSRKFNKHSINALGIIMIQSMVNTSGSDLLLSLPHRNINSSGKFSYSYDSRYYTEFNFGYNGSERFAESHRFGFFPSFGVAWTASNEAFFSPIKDVINNLRFRFTYGIIGNDEIGAADDRFFYLSRVDMDVSGRGATFGQNFDNHLNGVKISRYENNDVTWELSKKTNLGIEIGLAKALNLTVDLYKEERNQILMTRVIPTLVGLSEDIRANVGRAASKGVDISADYSKFFKNDTWLKIMGNFTYSKSWYVNYEEPVNLNTPWLLHPGYALSQPRGLLAERLFIDEKDVANSPIQEFGSEVLPGDIKYMDINGDGQITDLDVVPLGLPTTPEIVFGMGFSFGYKSFDISTFFQGLGRESFWINPNSVYPFVGGNQLMQTFVDNHYSPENPDIYALIPRFSVNTNGNNQRLSSWWLRDGSFMRLKQAEIGYSLPQKVTKKKNIDLVRFYVSGTNLLLFSKFKMWDVEMGGNGLGYPLQKTFNLGVNVNF